MRPNLIMRGFRLSLFQQDCRAIWLLAVGIAFCPDGRAAEDKPLQATASGVRGFNFENDVEPILSRFGCNASGCHGKAEGQNGFKLSVFGFDPAADYAALTKEGRGRRVFPAAPERSLLLQKASGGVPHGGGVRIARGSEHYHRLLDWIAAGAPFGSPDDPRVVSIRLSPCEQVMAGGSQQPLKVTAQYSDGREEDVTPLAKFQVNNDVLASVDEAGVVTAGSLPGQAAVMASFLGAVDTFRLLVPRGQPPARWPRLPEHNFIDTLVDAQLRKLNIAPSGPCDDATFLRRVYLDVIGTLPTANEARAFLADASPDKRQRLVDTLLQRPEYADSWALIWSDLLRVDTQALGKRDAYNYYRWIRDSFAANKPLNQFARELLTAEGPNRDAPAAAFYAVNKRPGDMAAAFSQAFLGVRIACAECHHHPFDRWSQRDYYGMAAYFAQVQRKESPLGPVLLAEGNPQTTNPRTGETVLPYPLGGEMPAQPSDLLTSGVDRRPELAAWLTAKENSLFARNMANRVWARLLGRGLVDPADDFRETNPPSNPELLDALAKHLVDSGFNQHELIRAIVSSRTYQLSTTPNETNRDDVQNYSRAFLKRLDAEVLLDAVCHTTGVGEKFAGLPAGSRAITLWDNRSPHYFLRLFGRPLRASTCECERVVEASIAQVLHLMNSPQVDAKLGHAGGNVAMLEDTNADDAKLVDELYLTFFARFPSDEERAGGVAHFRAAADRQTERREAAEDLAWSLLNSLEFAFNH